MKLSIVTIILLIVLTSNKCSNETIINVKNDSNTLEYKSDSFTNLDSKTDFENYIDLIPLLDIGYSVSSEESFRSVSIKSMFIPEGSSVIGKLKSIDRYYFILYTYPGDIIIPILETYDCTGRKLSAYELFDYSFCADIENENQHCRFTLIDSHKIERVKYLVNDYQRKETIYKDTLDVD